MGRHIVFPIVVCLCVYPSVCLSVANGVRSITLKHFKLFFLETGFYCSLQACVNISAEILDTNLLKGLSSLYHVLSLQVGMNIFHMSLLM